MCLVLFGCPAEDLVIVRVRPNRHAAADHLADFPPGREKPFLAAASVHSALLGQIIQKTLTS